MTLTVAAVQMAATDHRGANLARAEELIREAAAGGATLVLLPEIFAAPFVTPEPDLDYFTWAEPADGPSATLARRLSGELAITVMAPLFEAGTVPGAYFNATFTFRRGELVHHYRKSHLPFSNGFPEKFYFRPGAEPPSTFPLDDTSVGTIICYERHFPELSRALALAGAEVMCVPVACASAPTKAVFELELRAHAAFNSMFVVCANRIGTEGTKTYYGASAVYGPDGTVLASGGDTEGVVMATIDPADVRRRRHVLPFFRDRRPDLYGALVRLD